jgi:hypothetical protein
MERQRLFGIGNLVENGQRVRRRLLSRLSRRPSLDAPTDEDANRKHQTGKDRAAHKQKEDLPPSSPLARSASTSTAVRWLLALGSSETGITLASLSPFMSPELPMTQKSTQVLCRRDLNHRPGPCHAADMSDKAAGTVVTTRRHAVLDLCWTVFGSCAKNPTNADRKTAARRCCGRCRAGVFGPRGALIASSMAARWS